MAKKPTVGTLLTAEQISLRVLISQRELINAAAQSANAQLQAANGNVQKYLIGLLTSRGLDPAKWGVSPDMTTFVEIQQPAAPTAPPPASVGVGAQAAAQEAPPLGDVGIDGVARQSTVAGASGPVA